MVGHRRRLRSPPFEGSRLPGTGGQKVRGRPHARGVAPASLTSSPASDNAEKADHGKDENDDDDDKQPTDEDAPPITGPPLVGSRWHVPYGSDIRTNRKSPPWGAAGSGARPKRYSFIGVQRFARGGAGGVRGARVRPAAADGVQAASQRVCARKSLGGNRPRQARGTPVFSSADAVSRCGEEPSTAARAR
jgi:hypothetical protein